jgi:hypothetical protein
MGVAWPNPRFTDNEDETVTDNLTGLMWTKDANPPNNTITWQEALDYVAGTNTANGGEGTYGYNDWRLPNVRELDSLIDCGQYYPALPSGHPFTDQQSAYYWSSTAFESSTVYAWGVGMGVGDVVDGDKLFDDGYVWPVRGGH